MQLADKVIQSFRRGLSQAGGKRDYIKKMISLEEVGKPWITVAPSLRICGRYGEERKRPLGDIKTCQFYMDSL